MQKKKNRRDVPRAGAHGEMGAPEGRRGLKNKKKRYEKKLPPAQQSPWGQRTRKRRNAIHSAAHGPMMALEKKTYKKGRQGKDLLSLQETRGLAEGPSNNGPDQEGTKEGRHRALEESEKDH